MFFSKIIKIHPIDLWKNFNIQISFQLFPFRNNSHQRTTTTVDFNGNFISQYFRTNETQSYREKLIAKIRMK